MFDTYATTKINGVDISIYSDGSVMFRTKHDDTIYIEERDSVYELIEWIIDMDREILSKQGYK